VNTAESNMTLRDRVENKLERAQAGEIVHFGPLEARLAGFFVEDAMVESDLEGSYEEESL
jgi:hypothetical protein